MKMDFDITKAVEKIVMQAKENEEEFIIETIHPYCENILQIKINKEELKQILLNSMQKQQPCKDCISREDAVRIASINSMPVDECVKMIKALPSVKPKGLDQVKWERDTAINQLKELGYGFGEKIEKCDDCISRESVGNMLNNIKMRGSEFWIDYYRKALDGLSQLPSVTPTITDVENNYNIGYNCGYADAMFDISEGSESE